MKDLKLADRTAGVEESATLALNARVKQLAASGQKVYNLTAGEPAGDTPEYIQKQVATTLHHNKYTAVAGLPELRTKLAIEANAFYNQDWINADNIVVSAGAKPALYLAFLALLNPGDEVIVPTPMWVSYKNLVELAGGVVVPVPLTDDFDIDPHAVAAKLTSRTKAIIINSPHNPTGAVFSRSGLSQLADVLTGTDITVIADDLYTKLIYTKQFQPITNYPFEHFLIINGFSKSQALTGWRIGYVIADKHTAAAIVNMQSHMMGNASVPSQHAALAALKIHDKPPMLDDLKDRQRLVIQKLAAIPNITFHAPEGAFYVFLDLRKMTKNSNEWCERLLNDKQVALVPGEAFDAPGFARLTFVTDEDTLSASLDRIKQFVEHYS